MSPRYRDKQLTGAVDLLERKIKENHDLVEKNVRLQAKLDQSSAWSQEWRIVGSSSSWRMCVVC
jgi:hypothetical protein